MLEEHAETEAEVLQESFERAEAVLLRDIAEDSRDVAELDVGGAAGLAWRHAALDVLFGFALEVGFKFESGLGATSEALENSLEEHWLLPDGFEDAVNCTYEFVPAACLTDELFATCGGELVEAGFAVVFRRAPLGADPAAVLQAVEGGVQRAMLHLKDFVGAMFDDVGDRVAVGGAEEKRLQDEQIKGALEEVGFERWSGTFWHRRGDLQKIIYRYSTR